MPNGLVTTRMNLGRSIQPGSLLDQVCKALGKPCRRTAIDDVMVKTEGQAQVVLVYEASAHKNRPGLNPPNCYGKGMPGKRNPPTSP